jgi:hypothetical protein
MVTTTRDGLKVGWSYHDKNFRKGRSSKEYINSLKEPTKEDWQKLAAACIAAIIEDGCQAEANILVSFSYLMKFPKGFPRKFFVGVDGKSNIYQMRAVKLYEWLYEKGYATISLQEVERHRYNMAMMLIAMERKFLDSTTLIEYDDETQIGDLNV